MMHEKRVLTLFLLHLGVAATCLGQMEDDAPFCQILDRIDEPVWHAALGYVTAEDVHKPGGKDFGLIEFSGAMGLAYFYTDVGTFDLRTSLDTWAFAGTGGLDLPDQVGRLSLETKWTRRMDAGFALQVGAAPGFHSDLEDLSGEDFFLPLSVSAIQAFNEQASGLVGLAIYPGFERVVDPRIGVRWGIEDTVLIDLFYPESKIAYAPDADWQFYLGVRVLRTAEFQLEESDPRDRFMYDETRWYVGMNHTLSDVAQLMIKVGRIVDREVDFEHGPRANVDDAFFFQVGLGGVI